MRKLGNHTGQTVDEKSISSGSSKLDCSVMQGCHQWRLVSLLCVFRKSVSPHFTSTKQGIMLGSGISSKFCSITYSADRGSCLYSSCNCQCICCEASVLDPILVFGVSEMRHNLNKLNSLALVHDRTYTDRTTAACRRR
jgi:hypothetical protein